MKWGELKGKLQELVKDPKSNLGSNFNEALLLLVRERFLARAGRSTVKDSIVLKGGLLLTRVYTKSSRHSGDADINLNNARSLEDCQEAIDAILSVDLEDGFSFSRDGGTLLSNDQREYDGAQFQISGKFDGTALPTFVLDIGLGDAVNPVAGKLPTLAVFESTSIEILVYPPETIAAEKYHAIVSFGARNTRLKDFFDLFVLKEQIDAAKFKEALKRTFERRKTELPAGLPSLPKGIMQPRWEQFLDSKQYRVAENVPRDFKKILAALCEFYDKAKS